MSVILGYARVSTTGQSLEGQIESLTKYSNGNQIIIYKEKISGKDENRPELRKLLKTVQQGDIIVVTKLDRLGRSLIGIYDILKEIDAKGGKFESIGDPDIQTKTANGKLMFNILAAFAEWERSIINERMEAGRVRARANGIKFGRPSLKTKTGKFLDPKVIMDKHKKGLSARAIAKDLECSITPILKVIKASNSD